jgi:hypothetical protein
MSISRETERGNVQEREGRTEITNDFSVAEADTKRTETARRRRREDQERSSIKDSDPVKDKETKETID